MMMQDPWSSTAVGIRPSKSAPCSPIKPILPMMRSESFHIAHKVPIGDTPYVRAKRVQLVDKDPEKAIALFWAAINAGDRIDSALKDMAIVMKQQNRAEEAIEAIRSLRSRCSEQAQESLDNILLDLYKKCGRLDDQIALLKHKLHLIQQGVAFNGKRTKTARSQGRKFQVSLEQEATRLLGNLGWALMQQDNYAEAETAYRRALLIGPDSNKMCNLGICLMKQGRVAEAKETLKRVRPAMADGPRGVDSHLKAFERAQEMIQDLETKLSGGSGLGKADRLWPAEIFFMGSSSSVWQPQPCLDFGGLQDAYGDENVDVNRMPTTRTNSSSSIKAEQLPSSLLGNPLNKMAAITRTNSSSSIKAEQLPSSLLRKPLNKMAATTRTSTSSITTKPELPSSLLGNPLNVAAAPFFSRLVKKPEEVDRFQDPLGNLKRTRSAGEAMGRSHTGAATREKPEKPATGMSKAAEPQAGMGNKWLELLPDNDAFDEAIVAAVLAPVLEEGGEEAMAAQGSNNPALLGGGERNVGKRLRVFEDITHCLSPRA